MAIQIGFATFDPESGNGNQVVSVSADNYEGRVIRSVTAQVATTDSSITRTVVVNQQAVSEFVEIDESASVSKDGGSVTISGRSNSTTLTFSLSNDATLQLTLPDNYTAAGDNTAESGVEISGDPGASGAYVFSIVFTGIAENTTVSDLTNILTVQAYGGATDSCVITQTAGDPTLEIDTDTITIPADGTAQSLQITSNTNWTISQVISGAFLKAVAAARKTMKK